MNKYIKTYINHINKIAEERINDQMMGLAASKQDKGVATTKPKVKPLTKLPGIPASAKPSEADLNDRAAYE